MSRAQTTLDFAIGISVFLVAIALIFTFTPTLFTPFTGGGSAETVAADRAADQLAMETLADPDHPYLLDESATQSFFSGSAANARTVLAVDRGLNVTLARASGPLIASVGPKPSNTASVAVAVRVVSYDGKRADLEVRVW
ncbi:DUF7287 family protein [Halocalculus aciditolerans]|uniref:Uncharacterized protein n=1 Tax=Halocalculus aciditolerans TaxID=1383812 RepID=A0A830FBR3_9EURY|nr:hypothetical protein [Halocalculus aciditolerans]GGL58719.1 hypothetical protein GCM10009039_16200 [Halocalculus aciditolerans]